MFGGTASCARIEGGAISSPTELRIIQRLVQVATTE